jgi:hypothetical protein
MNRRLMVKGMVFLCMMGLLTLGISSSVVLAGGNPHVAEAIAHAEAAVEHGELGHADVLVEHAQEGLTHAQAAQKEVKNPHLDEGVHELMESIDHGKKGHAEIGTKHAKSAVMHLKEVQ